MPHSVATRLGAAKGAAAAMRRAGTFRTVLPVHEAQVELADRREVCERGEVRLVVMVDRHRQVQPGERTIGCGHHGVRVADEIPGIPRLEEVLLPRVAVAEVHTHLDVGRHRVDQHGQARDETVERVAGPPRLHDGAVAGRAFDDAHLARDIPLHREVFVRDGGQDPVELAHDRGGVDGLDRRAVIAVKNEEITASGVGKDTWNRTPAGTAPSARSRVTTA